MGKINIGRVIIAGLVAGIVADILSFLVDGMFWRRVGGRDDAAWTWRFLAKRVDLVQRNRTCRRDRADLDLCGIRPRFGAGVQTAIYAGIVYWFVASLLPNLTFMWVGGLFSRH